MPELDDLEQELVKQAVETIAARIGAKKTNDPKMKDIIATVERFIKKHELVCYGGTAINNILPELAQFYDKKTEIPDYADAEDLLDEPEPRERATSTATTSSSKPRIAKQPQKKQKKFVPLKVTENTNRTNEVTAIITANKLEINVPKRKLQTMEAMKRHNRKWKSINTQHKQSAARGSRIANIPQPRFDGDSN